MIQRIFLDRDPFPTDMNKPGYHCREDWLVSWIQVDSEYSDSTVTAFRLCFELTEAIEVPIHVSADQRYRLYLDGEWVARGSERGTTRCWYYESFLLKLAPGKHTLGAVTWFLGSKAPWAQAGKEPGFMLAAGAPYTELLSTGLAPWQGCILDNIEFLDPVEQFQQTVGCGARIHVSGMSPFEVFDKQTDWLGVRTRDHGNNAFKQGCGSDDRLMVPATLPPMKEEPWLNTEVALVEQLGLDDPTNPPLNLEGNIVDEQEHWQALLQGNAVEISANTHRRVLLRLNDYCCVYPRLQITGGDGAEVRISSAERLSISDHMSTAAEDRLTVDGRYFVGIYDQYTCDGAEHCFEPLWWQAGCWIMLDIQTNAEPLTVSALDLFCTGYPLEKQSDFDCDDPIFKQVLPVSWRTLQSCMHETYMDCPFFEQLQYLGDTRLQALITYVCSDDDRLAQKAIDIFSYSLIGAPPFTASNYPSRSIQIIPPFSLWWICMVHDHGLWRGDAELVRRNLPTVWWILNHFLLDRDASGMVRTPKGWNYVDSCAFDGGEPPGAEPGGVSPLINWHLVLALKAAAVLEAWVGAPEMKEYASRLATETAAAIVASCWDESRQALADDLAHQSFSEHSQALALLSGMLDEGRAEQVGEALCSDSDLLRAGPYFSHYTCEAYALLGRGDLLLERVHGWQRFLDAGFHTFPEHDIVGRSDCHAWSAHPQFHALASILGVRPSGMGFERVQIKPALNNLQRVKGKIPHPKGMISVSLERDSDSLKADINLPDGIEGALIWEDKEIPLTSGENKI